jgi:hypothetical protein
MYRVGSSLTLTPELKKKLGYGMALKRTKSVAAQSEGSAQQTLHFQTADANLKSHPQNLFPPKQLQCYPTISFYVI